MADSSTRARRARHWWVTGLLVVLAAGAAWFWWKEASPPAGPGSRGGGGTIPVSVATVSAGHIDRVIRALGTVTSVGTVTIRSRVDGPLESLHFTDGQAVHGGDLLAVIDPHPFEIQLQQSLGQQAQHLAQLENARLDLARYEKLFKQNSVARQQLDTARAQVQELQGQARADAAAVADARLQLGYTRIVAPVDGRLGLRKVDIGNMIHASDTGGLVVLTRMRPIDVLFSIPQGSLPAVLAARRQTEALRVQLLAGVDGPVIASGELLAVDNQIDVATGTVQLKARFANTDESLFPNQFTQVRLRLGQEDGVVAPLRAILRNSAGPFVYRVNTDQTVHSVAVSTGVDDGTSVIVETGLQAGDRIVVEGTDRLRDGSKVEVVTTPQGGDNAADNGAAAPPVAPRGPGGARGAAS